MKLIYWYCGKCGIEFEAEEIPEVECPECHETLHLGY